MMKTFSFTDLCTADLTATDLREQNYAADGMERYAYTITIFNEDGSQAPERAEALYFPGEGRLGVAWGAEATWADVKDVESGIEMWLNDEEAWERGA